MLEDLFSNVAQNGFGYVLNILPYALPIILGVVAWNHWMGYIQTEHIRKLKWKLLQIRIPQDVFKSPAAMEIFLANALYQSGGMAEWNKKYWNGNVPVWFSLEIVSIEGRLFFFIHTQERFRPIIEAQLYAQFPQAEVVESEDYTNMIPPYNKGADWNLFGSEFVLTKEDPYPIKTYVDFGLDKSSGMEEEEKIDPIAPTIEYMGSLGAGEQMWLQIIIQAANWARYDDPEHWFKKKKWQDVGKEIIKKLKADQQKPLTEGGGPARPTKGENDMIAAVERSITKYGFDTGIRAIYLAHKDMFKPIHITGLLGMFRQYTSGNMNAFKPANTTSFDYPWQDFSGNKVAKLKAEMIEAYRNRGYFHGPWSSTKTGGKNIERKPFVLTTEELATIYHFPGRVLETPSFKRIESKKSEPPSNLPI
ncbi:MAG: hypothetical protein KBC67_03680 [Candidatus Pacebacteria bacterium]|nr:hypothetical protein [Candidatus Paceibacterota bacterium]